MITPKHHTQDPGNRVGDQLGVNDWITIDQARLDTHAETTGGG